MQHSAAHVGVTDHKQEVVDEELEFYSKATVLAGASFIDCRSFQDQKAATLPSKMIVLSDLIWPLIWL